MGLGRGSGFSDGKITIGTQVDTYGISQGLNKIQKSFNKLKSVSGLLGGFGLVKLGKQAIEAASNLAEVQNIVDVSFGDMEYKIEEFAKTCIDSFGMSELSAKQTAGSFMAMGKASGIAEEEASDMAVRLTALSGDMASFYNIRQEYARVALSAVYTGETETLKRYGIILTEANLQQYALTQGITTSVKAMSARDKAMLRYNYILHATADVTGDFVRTQDNWANQVRVLKEVWNQFLITVGSGLITVLKPALKILNTFIRYLTAWANKIGHILAKLLGIEWEEISSGAGEAEDAFDGLGGSTEDLSDNTDDLGNSIKKAGKQARKALAPFDELNVISEDLADSTDDVASGLGGIVPMTEFDMGDIMGGGFSGDAFDIELPDISSWYDFGEYLSKTFKGILDDINWDEVYEKARTFAHNLADFLNGLIQPDTFRSVGKTIAGALNTGIAWALEFGQTFDFTNFGVSLSEALNGFFEDWNATDAAEVINTWADGFWEAIKAFFAGDEEGNGGLDWPLISNKFDEFFETLDATNFIDGLQDIWEGANVYINPFKFFLPKDEREWMDQAAKDKLKEGVEQLWKWYFDERNLYSPFSVIQLATGFEFDPELIEENGGWGAFAKKIMEKQGEYIGEPIAETVSTAIQALTTAWGNVKTWFTDNIATPLSEAFTTAWSTVTETWGNIQTWFDENVKTPITDTFNSIVTFIDEKTLWIRQVFESISLILNTIFLMCLASFKQNIIDPLVKHFQDLWDKIKTIWGVVSDWFRDTVIEPLVKKFTDLVTKVSTFFITLWTKIKLAWGGVVSWFVTTVIQPLVTKFTLLKLQVKGFFTDLWADIKNIWVRASDWFNTWVITPITDFFTTMWTNIVSAVKGGVNNVITIIEDFINSIIDGLNFFTSILSTLAEKAATITGKDYGGIIKLEHISIPRLAQGGVIPPNKEFLAVLGDQKHGTNIEAPLDTIVDAMKVALSNSENGLVQALLQQQVQLLEIIADKCGITDRDIANSIRRTNIEYVKMTGTGLLG